MNFETRKGRKKGERILLDDDQATAIKDQPDTPAGRRDKLLVCLALDHGLRVSELASLQRSDFDLAAGTVTFDRSETVRRDTHNLSQDTLEAARNYFAADIPGFGSIWRPGHAGQDTSTRAISRRIRALGKRIAIDNLSPRSKAHLGDQRGQKYPLRQAALRWRLDFGISGASIYPEREDRNLDLALDIVVSSGYLSFRAIAINLPPWCADLSSRSLYIIP